ncbi:MAG TPA: hypothetical protein VKB86_13590 [Pyrinomonadaceae bacterium]|nr:hypothetical protein [Pyrinomonadaceae bacterium]
MQEERGAKSRTVYENLDTAYVNLAALVRYLQGREFAGRVHVELDEYEADVFLNASEKPRVREKDHATGRQAEGEDALQRLLVRAREPGGLVSVYENRVGETGEEDSSSATDSNSSESVTEVVSASDEESDWLDMVRLSGELIATIERAALSAGADFVGISRAVRIEMADDYSFLDPSAGRFEYANGTVHLRAKPNVSAYVAGVSEAMRRVVDRIATGPRRESVRERVALELAVLARRRQSQLAKFKFTPQLDRIAGTRVL